MIENKYNITIGSDPEVFIEKDREIVSGIDMIPGTKKDPFPISDNGHCIQTDNIAFEFNIPPSSNEQEFVDNINFVKEYLDTIAKSKGCSLSTKCSGLINPDELKHPQAMEFGCEPDLNPYLKKINPKPEAKDWNLRCVGGHIHIGYPNPNQETSEKIVKAFDIFVALPCLLIDKDDRRRELYGKAGAFRFKEPWGVECRVLSNFWIHSDELMKFVYNRTIAAVNCVLDGDIDFILDKYSSDVVKAINTNNKKLAGKLVLEIFENEELLIN